MFNVNLIAEMIESVEMDDITDVTLSLLDRLKPIQEDPDAEITLQEAIIYAYTMGYARGQFEMGAIYGHLIG